MSFKQSFQFLVSYRKKQERVSSGLAAVWRQKVSMSIVAVVVVVVVVEVLFDGGSGGILVYRMFHLKAFLAMPLAVWLSWR